MCVSRFDCRFDHFVERKDLRSFVINPSSDGRTPSKKLFLVLKTSKFVRSPNSEGIVPAIPLLLALKYSATRTLEDIEAIEAHKSCLPNDVSCPTSVGRVPVPGSAAIPRKKNVSI